MKFLVDSCAGRLLAEWLREQGHDVVRVRDRGRDPGDVVILRWAVEEGRILVTMDKDFGALSHRDRLEHAGPIRFPRSTVEERKALCAAILARYGDDPPGAIVTVRGDVIKLSTRVEPNDD